MTTTDPKPPKWSGYGNFENGVSEEIFTTDTDASIQKSSDDCPFSVQTPDIEWFPRKKNPSGRHVQFDQPKRQRNKQSDSSQPYGCANALTIDCSTDAIAKKGWGDQATRLCLFRSIAASEPLTACIQTDEHESMLKAVQMQANSFDQKTTAIVKPRPLRVKLYPEQGGF